MFRFRAMGMALVLTVASIQLPLAQDSTSGKGCSCFFGRPAPRCCGFFVIEGGLKFRSAGANQREKAKTYQLSYEFGYMVNHGPRWAYGGTLYWSGDDDGSRFAVRARARKWVTNKTALDYSAGLIVAGSDNHVGLKTPGFVGTASYGYANWLSLSVTFDAIRIGTRSNFPDELPDRNRTYWRTGWYFGGMLSHWPAIASPIILIVLIGATWDS